MIRKFKANLSNVLRPCHKRNAKHLRAVSSHTDIPRACHLSSRKVKLEEQEFKASLGHRANLWLAWIR